jgi:Family of unknown function (DUF5681)
MRARRWGRSKRWGGQLPADEPTDYEIGYGKPPVATRFKKTNRANPRGRPRGSTSLAVLLQRALDAPADDDAGGSKRRRFSKRELMVRNLVERSAGADLAATKLLFEMLRKIDPRAVGPDPHEATPFGEDALTLLKERLARLARAQMPEPSAASARRSKAPDPTDPQTN